MKIVKLPPQVLSGRHRVAARPKRNQRLTHWKGEYDEPTTTQESTTIGCRPADCPALSGVPGRCRHHPFPARGPRRADGINCFPGVVAGQIGAAIRAAPENPVQGRYRWRFGFLELGHRVSRGSCWRSSYHSPGSMVLRQS